MINNILKNSQEVNPYQKNKTFKILRDFSIQIFHPIMTRKPGLSLFNNKKRTCYEVYFAIPSDHKVKIREGKRLDKYLDLSRELKNL